MKDGLICFTENPFCHIEKNKEDEASLAIIRLRKSFESIKSLYYENYPDFIERMEKLLKDMKRLNIGNNNANNDICNLYRDVFEFIRAIFKDICPFKDIDQNVQKKLGECQHVTNNCVGGEGCHECIHVNDYLTTSVSLLTCIKKLNNV